MNELHEVRAKWYHLGVQLNMRPSDLDAIRVQFMNNPEDCLLEMLSLWLKREDPSPPSWQRVVDALCSPAIVSPALADKISKKYCNTQNVGKLKHNYLSSRNVIHVYHQNFVFNRPEFHYCM